MKRKFWILLFAVACAFSCAFGVACGAGGNPNSGDNPSGNPSDNPSGNPSDNPGTPSGNPSASFNPVLTCEVTSAEVEATAGTKLNDCRLEVSVEYALYPSEKEYANKGTPYDKKSQNHIVNFFGKRPFADTEIADDDLKQKMISALNFIDWRMELIERDNTLSNMLYKYQQDFAQSNTDGMPPITGDPNPDTYLRKSVTGAEVASVLTVNLLSNENNPIALELTDAVSMESSLLPYCNYQYSDLKAYKTFPTETYDSLVFTKEDFAFLGALAGDDGVCIKLNRLEFAKVYKGVYYNITVEIKNDYHDPVTLETKAYYGTDLTKKVYFKEETVVCDRLTFTEQDIDECSYSHGEIDLQLKLYTDPTYEESLSEFRFRATGNVSTPQSAQISIPDMEVCEAVEKMNDITVTLNYADGFKIVLDDTQFDAGSLYLTKGYSLYSYFDEELSSDQPKTVEVKIDDSLTATDTFTLSPSLGYAKFGNKSGIENTYYEFQQFEVPSGVTVVNYYYTSHRYYKGNYRAETEEKAADAELFKPLKDNIDNGVSGTVTISLATDKMRKPELCDKLSIEVKPDTVASISVRLGMTFSGIIVGEPIDLSDCFVDITMTHGQEATLPLTLDMIGDYEQTTGVQSVEIVYKEARTTVDMTVRKVKSISVAEGLDKYYLLNDTPQPEVWLKVVFTDDDYDYLRCPDGRVGSLDLSQTGSGSVTISYGGAQTTFGYTVIEGAYITYSVTDGKITMKKFVMGKPSEDTKAFVPADAKNIVIPAEIDGVPVTAIAANAFKGQTILQSLTVPESVTTVGYGAVDGCSNLKKLTVSGNIPLSKFFTQYQKATVMSSAVYPNMPEKLEVVISGETLCDNFFADLYFQETKKTVAKLTLGDNLTAFGEQSPYQLKFVKDFGGGGEKVFAKDGVVYTDGGATLAYYSAHKEEAKFTIPEGVTKATINSDYITELTIPAHVTTLGDYFMDNALELTKVVIEAGSAITALPDGAFSGCEKLTTFNFPEKLVTIGSYALSSTAVEKIILPSTVTTVAHSAFNNAKCTHFYIPTGATKSFVKVSSMLTLPSLKVLAYDGSVSVTSLIMLADNFSRQTVELYITGENTEVCDEWYSNYASNRVSKLFVCKEAAKFDHRYFSPVVWEKTGATVDRWWKA